MRERPLLRERGQSSVVGYALLFGIVMLGVTTIVLLGAVAIDDVEQTARLSHGENAMTKLDSEISRVALGESEVSRVDLGTDVSEGDVRVEGTAGRMRVTQINTTTGARTALLNVTLGAVVYDLGAERIAYQGGGVWRETADGSRMRSPPEIHYRDATLTMPLVKVRPGARAASGLEIRDNGSATYYPVAHADRANPLQSGQVELAITSRYYEAWGEYFETRTDGDVSYDHPNRTAVVTLVVPLDAHPVLGAVTSDATLPLTVGNNVESDSYNSTVGDYAATQAERTNVITRDDAVLSNNMDIRGDLVAAGDVSFNNPNAKVHGNLSYGGSVSPSDPVTSGHVGGWAAPNASFESMSPVDGLIDQQVLALRDANDNDASDVDVDESTNTLEGCSSTCELDAGRYYLEGLSLGSSDRLEIDTAGGDVTVVVDGDMTVDNGYVGLDAGNDNTVRFYVTGDLTVNKGNAEVDVPNERAPRLWVFMNSDASAQFTQGPVFDGVVYGPGDEDAPGVDFTISQQTEIYGGLVGDVTAVSNRARLHYDEALSAVQPVAHATSLPHVTYMHVSVNRVDVSGGTSQVSPPSTPLPTLTAAPTATPTATAASTPAPTPTPAPPPGSPPSITSFSVDDKSQCRGPGCRNGENARFKLSWETSDADLQSTTVYVNGSGGSNPRATYSGVSGNNVQFQESGSYGVSYSVKIVARDATGQRTCEVIDDIANGDTSDQSRRAC